MRVRNLVNMMAMRGVAGAGMQRRRATDSVGGIAASTVSIFSKLRKCCKVVGEDEEDDDDEESDGNDDDEDGGEEEDEDEDDDEESEDGGEEDGYQHWRT